MGAPGHAEAQSGSDPATNARVRIGPLAFTPTLTLTNVGIDGNVFNDPEDPVSDLTAAVRPAVESWLRLGRARLHLTNSAEYVYFNRYASQRTLSTNNNIEFELVMNRLTPYLTARYVNARERPSLEVDTRARRRERGVGPGLTLTLSPKTVVGVGVRQLRLSFDDEETFRGADLRSALNRVTESLEVSFRYDLTPLTRLVVLADASRDEFELSPERTARSLRVRPTLEFNPFALLTGQLQVGILRFDPADQTTRNFTGMTVSTTLSYVLLGRTQFTGRVARDVVYSVGSSALYYVQTGVGGAVTRRLGEAWDVRGTIDRQRLSYPAPVGGVVPSAIGDTDVYSYGVSAGYRFSRGIRLGVNAQFDGRSASNPDTGYENFRVFSSFSYGSP